METHAYLWSVNPNELIFLNVIQTQTHKKLKCKFSYKNRIFDYCFY